MAQAAQGKGPPGGGAGAPPPGDKGPFPGMPPGGKPGMFPGGKGPVPGMGPGVMEPVWGMGPGGKGAFGPDGMRAGMPPGGKGMPGMGPGMHPGAKGPHPGMGPGMHHGGKDHPGKGGQGDHPGMHPGGKDHLGKGGVPGQPGKGGVGTGGVMAVDPGQALDVSIRIPRDKVEQHGDILMYAVDVTSNSGEEPWRVYRSYQDFYVFCERLGPQAKSYPDATLPGRTLHGVSDATLEERRLGLERWLTTTLAQPQCKGPWLRFARAFLREGRKVLPGNPAQGQQAPAQGQQAPLEPTRTMPSMPAHSRDFPNPMPQGMQPQHHMPTAAMPTGYANAPQQQQNQMPTFEHAAAMPTSAVSSPTYTPQGAPPTYTGPAGYSAGGGTGQSQIPTTVVGAPQYDGYGGDGQAALGTTMMTEYMARPPQAQIPSSSAIMRDHHRPTELEVEIPPGVEAGRMLAVTVPGGREIHMPVPAGAAPGAMLRMRLDPMAGTLTPVGF